MLHSTWRRIHGATCTIAALVVGLTGVGSPAAAQEVLAALTNDSSTISEPVSFDLSHLLGASGKLRAVQFTQEQLEADSSLGSLVARLNAGTPGIHRTELRSVDGAPLVFVNLIPFEAKTGGTLQGYKVGYWPSERKKGITTALPVGFIEVTEDLQDLQLSEHFRVRDFVTKDQYNVWPKFLLVQPALLDKLELVIAELEELGAPSTLRVLSGFRTPQYNQRGVCRRCGRAKDSRHMYGDAADLFVDADGNGVMDDLNGDGKVTTADAQFLARVVERVEAAHPELVGGIGIYRARRGHGPFLHVDTRGFTARW